MNTQVFNLFKGRRLGIILIMVACLMTGRDRVIEASKSPSPVIKTLGSSDKLPSGVTSSDWSSILRAHREWKHEVRTEGKGWRVHNPETDLNASFDGRGVDVHSAGADWSWGLDLISYGIGDETVEIGERVPEVKATGRRVAYGWDGNLEEWYRNEDQGLEHGYTIQRRPESSGMNAPLVLKLKIRGELRVTTLESENSVGFGKNDGETLIRYSNLKVIDAGGREISARFDRSDNENLQILVDDQSATYPLTIDPVTTQPWSGSTSTYLKASNTDGYDGFGKSVAISGNTIVVGSSIESSGARGINGNQSDNSAGGAGAAYVFVKNGGTWSQQAYLKASNTDNSIDYFGMSVAISGDTIVVGAPSEDSNAKGVNGNQSDNSADIAGAAYVFVRSGVAWSQQAYLKASNTDRYDDFGQSVAISGDTIVIGAHFEDSNAKGVNGNQSDNSADWAGAAYVFVKNGVT
jgi:hypothetical protein